MTQEGFFGLVGHQLRSDLASAPATARRWLSEGGRAERCLNIAELRALARGRIPRAVFDYVDGAAGALDGTSDADFALVVDEPGGSGGRPQKRHFDSLPEHSRR